MTTLLFIDQVDPSTILISIIALFILSFIFASLAPTKKASKKHI